MSNGFPPFKLGASLYDLGTFKGRLYHFYNVIHPRTLLTSKERLDECTDLLDRFKKEGMDGRVSNEDMWKAQQTIQAITHPDTGKTIAMPFRMSGYVLCGSPLVVGLLLPNPSLASSVFWQWLNQSHNACVNYANRNASKETQFSRFIFGYIGAVSSAVTIAVGLSLLINKSATMTPMVKLVVQKFVPFPAVVTASTCNIYLMRKHELEEGIEVFNEDNELVGTSQTAAKKALWETTLTRMFLPAPIFLIPPIIMTLVERSKLLIRLPRLHLPINAFVSTLTFAISLPIAISIFPQISSIETDKLESEIRSRTQNPRLFYNKGL